MQNQIDRVIINPDMGAMHDLHNLSVNAARFNAQLLPESKAFFGGAAGKLNRAFLFTKLTISRLSHIQSNFLFGAVLDPNAVFFGNRF